MKKLVDYLAFLYHRPRLFDTKFFGIVTGSPLGGDTARYLEKCVSAWGGTWVGSLSVVQGAVEIVDPPGKSIG